MTEIELAKLIKEGNYGCKKPNIDCDECIKTNRFHTCLMYDKKLYVEMILGEEVEENEINKLKKENEQLKKEISVLLSCANCKENKGGYVCEKEYNDKCLAQKIEYIKELKEENAELKAQVKKQQHQIEIICNTQKQRMMLLRYIRIKENLEAQVEKMKCCGNCRKELVCIKAEGMNICEEWEFEK